MKAKQTTNGTVPMTSLPRFGSLAWTLAYACMCAIPAGCSGTIRGHEARDSGPSDGRSSDGGPSDDGAMTGDGGPGDGALPTDGTPQDAQPQCSATTGVDTNGVCAVACGAAAPCAGLGPGQTLSSCQGAGNTAIQDQCTATCQLEDQPAMICRATGIADCTGDPECDNVQAGTGDCDQDCRYDPPCLDTGRITVSIDGNVIFDRDPPKLLECLGLHFDPYQYGNGPPGAQVIVVTDIAGLFEADLLGFADDHQNCEEKWGFVNLQGQCTDVLLEKWNANACSPYYTDQLKLDTWVDMNGDCAYQGSENDEPYGGHYTWDPAHTYRLRIEWD